MQGGARRLSPEIVRYWSSRARLLVAGKGPSLRHLERVPAGYFAIALNDAVNWGEFDAVHLIDFSVLEKIERDRLTRVRHLICPRLLNEERQIRLGAKTLSYFKRRSHSVHDVAARLERWGLTQIECLFYDYEMSSDVPWLSSKAFPNSGFILINLLMKLGCKQISVIGIDGGRGDVSRTRKKRLSIGAFSYSHGREEVVEHKLRKDASILDAVLGRRLRIFVGCEREQRLPFEVLRYSILKRSLRDVEVVPLYGVLAEDAEYQEMKAYGRTPFSFQRLFLDKIVDDEDQWALYFDSDMLVFGDVYDLLRQPVADVGICASNDETRERQSSVMVVRHPTANSGLFKAAREKVLETAKKGGSYFAGGDFLNRDDYAILPPEWNSMESFTLGRTQLLHFTDMDFQPWLSYLNPNGWLWMREVFNMLEDGSLTRDEVYKEIQLGHARPSLRVQIESGQIDALGMPRRGRRMDLDFLPPHRLMGYDDPVKAPVRRKLRLRVRNYFAYIGYLEKVLKLRKSMRAYLRMSD